MDAKDTNDTTNLPPDGRKPEFVSLPKSSEQEFYSSLRRSILNSLILANEANDFRPPVKSVSLRRPGAQKGKRLIHLQSLLDYLYGRMERQEEKGRTASPASPGEERLRS